MGNVSLKVLEVFVQKRIRTLITMRPNGFIGVSLLALQLHKATVNDRLSAAALISFSLLKVRRLFEIGPALISTTGKTRSGI